MEEGVRKQLLKKLQYGLYVMTAGKKENIAAGTMVWVSQCSFDPPMIMTGIRVESNLCAAVKEGQVFIVHFVGKSQKDVAASFFTPSIIEAGSINGIPYSKGVTGAPVLESMAGYIECEVREIVEKGDHAVVIGEILGGNLQNQESTLMLSDTDWCYES